MSIVSRGGLSRAIVEGPETKDVVSGNNILHACVTKSRNPTTVGKSLLFLIGLATTLTAHLSDDVAAGRVVVKKEWGESTVNERQKHNPDIIAVAADLNDVASLAILEQAVSNGSVVICVGYEVT